MKRLLLVLLLLFTLPAWSADRYWVGDSGYWTDATNHWASASGGAPDVANLPTSADDVFFDANSFTAVGQSVNIDGFTDACKNFTWTGATNVPNVGGYLNVYGSTTLIAGMTTTSGMLTLVHKGSGAGYTVTTAGQQLNTITFLNGGSWTLQDNVTAMVFGVYGTSTVNLNAKTLTLVTPPAAIGSYPEFNADSTATVSASGSTIVLTGTSGSISYASKLNASTHTLGTVTLAGIALSGAPHGVPVSHTIGTLQILGDNVYVKFTDGTTQTITGSLVTNAVRPAHTYLTGSGTAGWTLSKSSGKVVVKQVSLHYSHATGGAQWRADQSIDAGGNTGWMFGGANGPMLGCIF